MLEVSSGEPLPHPVGGAGCATLRSGSSMTKSRILTSLVPPASGRPRAVELRRNVSDPNAVHSAKTSLLAPKPVGAPSQRVTIMRSRSERRRRKEHRVNRSSGATEANDLRINVTRMIRGRKSLDIRLAPHDHNRVLARYNQRAKKNNKNKPKMSPRKSQ